MNSRSGVKHAIKLAPSFWSIGPCYPNGTTPGGAAVLTRTSILIHQPLLPQSLVANVSLPVPRTIILTPAASATAWLKPQTLAPSF